MVTYGSGCSITFPWDPEKAGGLWVWTLSYPFLADLVSFIMYRMTESSHFFHLLNNASVCLGLFLLLLSSLVFQRTNGQVSSSASLGLCKGSSKAAVESAAPVLYRGALWSLDSLPLSPGEVPPSCLQAEGRHVLLPAELGTMAEIESRASFAHGEWLTSSS